MNQILPDVWILGCSAPPAGAPASSGPAADNARLGDNPNCPDEVGPDFDFSASPALVTKADGTRRARRDAKVRRRLRVESRSARQEALGVSLGQRQPGRRRLGHDDATAQRAYFAVADQLTPAPGGLHAVDLTTGQRVWYVPPQTPVCASGPGCSSAQSAALTSIPGVVFSGSADGAMRAYASDSGKILWTFDTNRDFDTVNGVKADGGSMDGPGPVVAGGMLYVTAGNAGFVGTPGNVLLAFGLD